MAIKLDANQKAFQLRNDDGSETSATNLVALNTNSIIFQDKNYRLRYAVAFVGDAISGTWQSTQTVKFQYNKNSAGWNDITSASSVVRLFTSTYVTDETATTQQISSPDTFEAGNVLTTSTTTTATITGAGTMEIEECFQIRSADTSDNDSIQIRAVNNLGTVAATLTNTVTLTVVKFTCQGTITLDHTKAGTADSSGFTFPFSTTDNTFKSVANGGSLQNAPYDFMFFSDSALTSPLPFEAFEAYSASVGKIITWVKVPTLSHSTDTVIYIGYGSAGITSFQGGAAGTNWDGNSQLAVHLPDGTTLSANDSTASPANGTLTNTPTAITGIIGGGAAFASASSEYIDFGNPSKLQITGNLTLKAWVYLTDLHNYMILTKDKDSGGRAYTMDYNNDSTGCFRFYINGGGGSNEVQSTTVPSTATWYRVIATYNTSGTLKMYINGALEATQTGSSSSIPTATANVEAARRQYSGYEQPLNGRLDELGIDNIDRAASWITADYNSQYSPSTFYTISGMTCGMINASIAQTDATLTVSGGTQVVATVQDALIAQTAANITAAGGTQSIATINDVSIVQIGATVTATGGTQVVQSINDVSISQVAAIVTISGGTQVITIVNDATIAQAAASIITTGGIQSISSGSIINAAVSQLAANLIVTGGIQTISSLQLASIIQIAANLLTAGGIQQLGTVNNTTVAQLAAAVLATGGLQVLSHRVPQVSENTIILLKSQSVLVTLQPIKVRAVLNPNGVMV